SPSVVPPRPVEMPWSLNGVLRRGVLGASLAAPPTVAGQDQRPHAQQGQAGRFRDCRRRGSQVITLRVEVHDFNQSRTGRQGRRCKGSGERVLHARGPAGMPIAKVSPPELLVLVELHQVGRPIQGKEGIVAGGGIAPSAPTRVPEQILYSG